MMANYKSHSYTTLKMIFLVTQLTAQKALQRSQSSGSNHGKPSASPILIHCQSPEGWDIAPLALAL